MAFFWRRAGTWRPHWEPSIIPPQPSTSAKRPSGGTERSATRQAPGAVWLVRQPHQGRAQMRTATSASPAGAPGQGPRLRHHSCPSFSHKGLGPGQVFIKRFLRAGSSGAGTITIGSHLLPLVPQTHSGSCLDIPFRGQSGFF